MAKAKKKKKIVANPAKKAPQELELWVYLLGGAAAGLLVWFLYRIAVAS